MPTATPIVLFVFNRPDHLRRMIGTLKRCRGFADAPVFVFGDGPRDSGETQNVEATRAVAKELLGDRTHYRFSPTNRGLARSIIDGVTAVVGEHGRAIVLEDDLDLAPGFLAYMNEALDRYADDDDVYQISGYAFDAPELAARPEAVFLPFISTWGWATWQRAWASIDEAATGWEALKTDKALRRRFNLDGVYDYATMMERQMEGKRDSWGIRWYWSVFTRNGLVLYPPHTLVRNQGFDGSGSHGRGLLRHYGGGDGFLERPIELPPPGMDDEAFEAVKRAISRTNGGTVGRLVDLVKQRIARFTWA